MARLGRGGHRPGAGRKPKGQFAGVGHGPRPALAPRFPVYVTVTMCKGLPRLRSERAYAAVCSAFAAGRERFGFRLVHYAVLDDRLQLLVEAEDRASLSRGMQGLLVRVARALNRVWGRTGRVCGDRYHERVLKSPAEVRLMLRHMLTDRRQDGDADAIEAFTSAAWFDGWRGGVAPPEVEPEELPTVPARSWLLTTGWRRHGLLTPPEAATGKEAADD